MPRQRNLTPSYLRHRKSGQARAVWTDAAGIRHQKLLPGAFNSPESKVAHARLALELAATSSPVASSGSDLTIVDLLLAYLNHAERYYAGPDRRPTKEFDCMKAAVRPLRELYGDLPVTRFGPLALRAVRERMIQSGLCRALINRRIDRVKRVFKWGVAEELVPISAYEALRTLSGLRLGRTEARESKPVQPVPDEHVLATLPHLPDHIRVMVELMFHTGMRPSEVCGMKLVLIDRSDDNWLYRPAEHKTAYKGKTRVIPLGPRARRVLESFLQERSLCDDEPLFSPSRAREERFLRMRQTRRSKVQPSQQDRKKQRPQKIPGEVYGTAAVCRAVAATCKRVGVPHWHPYQLRHSFATRVRKQHGLEAAQVLLGHARADVTQVYAERDLDLALDVASRIG